MSRIKSSGTKISFSEIKQLYFSDKASIKLSDLVNDASDEIIPFNAENAHSSPSGIRHHENIKITSNNVNIAAFNDAMTSDDDVVLQEYNFDFPSSNGIVTAVETDINTTVSLGTSYVQLYKVDVKDKKSGEKLRVSDSNTYFSLSNEPDYGAVKLNSLSDRNNQLSFNYRVRQKQTTTSQENALRTTTRTTHYTTSFTTHYSTHRTTSTLVGDHTHTSGHTMGNWGGRHVQRTTHGHTHQSTHETTSTSRTTSQETSRTTHFATFTNLSTSFVVNTVVKGIKNPIIQYKKGTNF